MNYDYKKVKEEIKNLVKKANYSSNNYFGDTVYDFHITPVVEHSLNLGRVLNADLEVLELSALLHDYAAILNFDYYREHHKHGARLAGNILTKLNYSEDKIQHVQKCILNHRGSIIREKESVEEKIIVSADAMAHISNLTQMFYLSYGIHNKGRNDGVEFIKRKLQKSWDKIELEEGKEMVRKDFEIAKYILGKA